MSPENGVEEPPAKIPRLEDEEPSTSFSIRPLLNPSLTREELPLAEFHVLRVADRRQIGKVIKIVGELPEEFHHLKRVDPGGRVLLQARREGEELADEFISKLKEAGFSLEDVEVAVVPAEKPATRRQSDWARKRWATSFHPTKEIEDLLCGDYFSDSDRNYVRRWSRKAEEIGCVVVQRDHELASGSSSTRLLAHPVMEMISNLAEKKREGTEYLATNCDVFLAMEPCAMCAMALVHARAARVFFRRRSRNGVLSEGTWQLHLVPSFNHHYKVFHVDDGHGVEEKDQPLCR